MRSTLYLPVALLSLAIAASAQAEDTAPQGKEKAIAAAHKVLRHASGIAAAAQEQGLGGAEGPASRLLQEIALAQAKAGDTRGALRTAAAIREDLWKATTLEAIRGTVPGGGHAAAASTPPRQAVATPGVILDRYNKLLASRAAVLAAADGGNAQRALELAGSVENAAWKANILAALAGNRLDAGDAPGALRIAANIPSGPERAKTLSSIALARARAGDRRGAGLIFQAALKAAAAILDEPAKADALRAIAGALAEAGYVRVALLVARDARSPLVKSGTLLGTAEGILRLVEAEELQAVAPAG